jgi:chromosome segregation ATPase
MFEIKTKGGETVRLDEATVAWLNEENKRLHFVDKSAAIRHALALARKPSVDGVPQSEYDRVNAELQAVNTEVERLRSVNIDVNAAHESVNSDYEVLQTRNTELQSEYDRVNAELQAVNSDYENVNIQRLQSVDAVNQENQALLARIATSIELDEKQYAAFCAVNQNRVKQYGKPETITQTFWGFFIAYHDNPEARFFTGF